MLGHFGPVLLFYDPVGVTHKAPLAMAFFRQEYFSGLQFPYPRDLPDPGIEATSMSPALAGRFLAISATWEAQVISRARYFCKVWSQQGDT